MNRAAIEGMMLEYIPAEYFAGIAETTFNANNAYIAQLTKPLCLGCPVVIIANGAKARYASKAEAERIVIDARKNNQLAVGSYV